MKPLANIETALPATIPSFIHYPTSRKQRLTAAAWMLVLYLSGLFAWGYFFSWGKVDVEFHDWADITAPRLQFLKDALTRAELPLHISDTSTLDYVTDRYLSVPDAFVAPQAVFLRWLDVGTFVFLDVLLLYSLGFWGLWRIQARFRLSPAAFSLLFLLFNFNGHILAHYAVGHATWGGYFLFPFFVLLISELFQGNCGWGWVARMSVLMAAIFLQGSFHQFVWLLIFLLLIAVSIPRYFRITLQAAFFSVAASLFRILPPALLLNAFDSDFIAGYPTVEYLWRALVEVAVPGDTTLASGMVMPIGWWEFTLYVGLAGALFLIGFGLLRWLGARQPQFERKLLIPLLALTFLSLGNTYQLFERIPIPLFAGERVTSRMLSVVFVFLLVVAVVEFQRWVDSAPRTAWFTGAAFFSILFIAQDLWQNLKIWQVNRARLLFPSQAFTPADWYVANNYGDGGYLALIGLGAGLSAATLLLLGFLVLRERRRLPPVE